MFMSLKVIDGSVHSRSEIWIKSNLVWFGLVMFDYTAYVTTLAGTKEDNIIPWTDI